MTYEKLFTFDYQILISKDNPLKDKDIYMKDLKKQIELKHGDIHIQEDHHNHKHMNIYERGIQFELLNESNMKKILFMIMTVLGWINLTSCNDYLDIVPKGNKIPTTLADFEALLRDEYTIGYIPVTNSLYLLNDNL